MRQLIATSAATLLFATALAACAGTDAPSAGAAPPPPKETEVTDRPKSQSVESALSESCNDAGAQKFVGQAATAEVIEQARVAAGARTARTLAPGVMVTMEYRAGRLNLDVDENNVIKSARCG